LVICDAAFIFFIIFIASNKNGRIFKFLFVASFAYITKFRLVKRYFSKFILFFLENKEEQKISPK